MCLLKVTVRQYLVAFGSHPRQHQENPHLAWLGEMYVSSLSSARPLAAHWQAMATLSLLVPPSLLASMSRVMDWRVGHFGTPGQLLELLSPEAVLQETAAVESAPVVVWPSLVAQED
jgi:hypothetical protein